MKPLHWLYGEVKTPPMTIAARKEMGFLLRLLQDGETLGLPHSRPMPAIGTGCHELRVTDVSGEWRCGCFGCVSQEDAGNPADRYHTVCKTLA